MTIFTDQAVLGIFLAFFGVLAVLPLGLRAKRVAQTGTHIVLSSMLAAICGSLTVAFVAGLFANYMKAEIQLWCIGLLVAGLQIGHSLQRAEPKHGHAAREVSHHG